MNKHFFLRIITILLLFIPSTSLFASTHDVLTDTIFNSASSIANDFLYVAGAGDENQAQPEKSGPLVLPDNDSDKSEKKCMKVCEKWGEDCVINPKTGSRKCRRVCKNFGEECF